MRVCCFTSLSFGYVPRALVLAASVRRAHPDWTLAAVLVDQFTGDGGAAALLPEFDRIVGMADLGASVSNAWLFKHDLVEACTAVKGATLNLLLAEGYDAVIYLDPDVALFSPLEEVEAALAQGSIVLTPHQTAPNRSVRATEENELTSLLFGTYNLGFIAVRNDGAGRAFGAWWAALLHRACYDDPQAGLFTDQRYIDLVPGLFDGVRILRDAGCNVASWNLSTRHVSICGDGAIRVNGGPLRFFHFTKVNGLGDAMLDRYGGDNVEVFELLAWYKRQLRRHAAHPAAALPWHYGNFSNGVPVPRAARLLYRVRKDLVAHFQDPFDADGRSYYGWLQAEHPHLVP